MLRLYSYLVNVLLLKTAIQLRVFFMALDYSTAAYWFLPVSAEFSFSLFFSCCCLAWLLQAWRICFVCKSFFSGDLVNNAQRSIDFWWCSINDLDRGNRGGILFFHKTLLWHSATCTMLERNQTHSCKFAFSCCFCNSLFSEWLTKLTMTLVYLINKAVNALDALCKFNIEHRSAKWRTLHPHGNLINCRSAPATFK